MLEAYKEEYKINNRLYTASADFFNNRIYLYGQGGFKYSGNLREYEDFEGNMEDFIISKLEGQNGL